MLDAARRSALFPPAMPIERAPARHTTLPWSGWIERNWRLTLLLLVVATFLIRARYFGNPFIDVDEEFYLLAGDRLLHGALPYVDVWDRKPVGLFLLYAGIRLLGGQGIVQYQLVAAAFVAATAVSITLVARRIASPGAALAAGLAYVLALAMSGGQGGQTPVFYNLPMVAGAWLLLALVAPANEREPRPARIRWHGAAAMLLVGLSLQIKYSAVFEGVFFGVVLLWVAWRTEPHWPSRAADVLLWMAMASAPTLFAWGWYVAIGEGSAFVYANFTSILSRGPVSASHQWQDFGRIVPRLSIFMFPILIGEIGLRRLAAWRVLPAGRAAHAFLAAWLIAALVGFGAFGTFFNHYALPLLPPLAILAAPTFAIATRHIGVIAGGFVLAVLAIAYPLDAAKHERRRGDAAWAAQVTAEIQPRLHGRCLYVFYGEPIYYELTRSCLPTRYPFPFHLSLAREAPALGIDARAETLRILATRPPVIVDRLTDDDEINFPIQALVRAELRRNYRLILSGERSYGADPNTDQVWERIPGR